MAVLDRLKPSQSGRIGALAGSDTGRAAGLAAAVMVGNVVALAFTVVFARVLGGTGYGSLAALLSTFVILMVPGSALQTTVAREVSAERAHGEARPGAGVVGWLRRLLVLTVVVTAASIAGRDLLAAAIGVEDVPWGAAAAPVAGCLWLVLSVTRGALQGFQRYRLVGASMVIEQVARLAFGIVLVAVGLDVTGAYIGTPLAVGATALALALPLRRELGRGAAPPPRERHPLRELFVRAGIPVVALDPVG